MSMTILKDKRGQVIGRISEQRDQLVYMNARGEVVARYMKSGDQTLDKNGRRVGSGDQGMIELGKTLL